MKGCDQVSSILKRLSRRANIIPLSGTSVVVLHSPGAYFDTLVAGISSAQRRLTLASLYCGTGGGKEARFLAELSATVHDAARPQLQIALLFDALRGTRQSKDAAGNATSTAQMLEPLLCPNVGVSLFHTPALRGLLKRVLPPRVSEVVGVCHLKAYIFDNDVLISGANLSNDYFTIRQDRYMLFRDRPELANHLDSLVKAVSNFSYRLQPGALLAPCAANLNPLTQPYRFQNALRERLEQLCMPPPTTEPADGFPPAGAERPTAASSAEALVPANQLPHMIAQAQQGEQAWYHEDPGRTTSGASASTSQRCTSDAAQGEGLGPTPQQVPGADTWLATTVQLGSVGLRQDEDTTVDFIGAALPSSTLTLSSPYLNLARSYHRALAAAAEVNVHLLTASPAANGFFGAAGAAGFIPTAYSLLQRSTWRSLHRAWRQHGRPAPVQRRLLEYNRAGWQFHAKGIWYTPPGERLPIATAVGSPNFGYRSVLRDLECQIFLVTSNERLRQALGDEVAALMKHAEDVSKQTLQSGRPGLSSYRGRLVARLLRSFL